VLAGPVCPVQRDPPDPGCAPRPVSGAVITVTNTESDNSSTAVSDDGGLYQVVVDAGPLEVVAGPVEGYLGLPDPVRLTGIAELSHVVDLLYDTGVR
jgi:hypothetical protein